MNSELKNIIYEDLHRYGANSTYIDYILNYWRIPAFKYIVLLRKTRYYSKHNRILYLLYRVLLRRCSTKYLFQVPYQAEIGKGFYIGHFGSVIINPLVKVGCNVSIATGTTIGQTNRGEFKGVPQIGDYVWIGTNAVIVGGITIGNNVLIAPNAYVNRSIPDNSIAIGNPAKIISKGDATKGYIGFPVEI